MDSFFGFADGNSLEQHVNLPRENNDDFKIFDEFIDPMLEDMLDLNSESTSEPNSSTRRTPVDRSRTLISERRRRGRMKEKLYALRSLVPNITKMDKASIVGDAVVYMQELQKQAEQLRIEIVKLESSLGERVEERQFHNTVDSGEQSQVSRKHSSFKKILQMDVFEIEERGFYVKTICMAGEGVAVALYKALESLTCFHVKTSNFKTIGEQNILTFTVNVRECGVEEISAATLRMLLMSALLCQGFDFKTPMAV